MALFAAAALSLGACSSTPSPVDMEDHPITSSTPSRAAGQELVRSTDPEEACAEEPLPADGGRNRVAVSPAPDAAQVSVPADPERILALGLGAVDAACALGLQDRVVATSALPSDASAMFPPRLTQAPLVDVAAPDARAAVAEADPDVVLLGADAGVTAEQVSAVLDDDRVPVIAYEDADTFWADAAAHAGAALGREDAMRDQLEGFVAGVQEVSDAVTPWDTQLSVVTVEGSEPSIADPQLLGVRVAEALRVSRPPSQLTEEGRSVPPPEHSPVVGDELAGDVIFVVKPATESADAEMREMFAGDRWQELDAAQHRRVFVVEEAAWAGHGLVAARTVLADLARKLNAYSQDG